MANITITSHLNPKTGKFFFVVYPGEGSTAFQFTSDAVFESDTEALIAGYRYLELQGIKTNNIHLTVNNIDALNSAS